MPIGSGPEKSNSGHDGAGADRRDTQGEGGARTRRATIAKPVDPRQAALFDAPPPGWIKPCLPMLVDKPPVGPEWVHEINWDDYRVSV